MRLQTFPTGYTVVGDLRAAQRQIGNAVPSALAERLALEIRRQFFRDERAPRNLTLLPVRRRPVPPPESIAIVPSEFLAYVGQHDAHPGTGKGAAALRRA